ncbi:MAG TPA: tetratricopeptide repeat protein, partial [Myxococcota bacterium]
DVEVVADAGVPMQVLRPAPAVSLLEQERLPIERGDVTDHRVLGAALLAEHRIDEAITALRQALVVDGSAETWSRLGAAYVEAGEVDRGLRCLEEAVTVDVDHLDSRRLLARTLLSRNDGARARAQAEEWVRLEPTSPQARQALGRSFTQLGMWREAIDEYRLVVVAQPDNAFAHNNLGYAALQVGDNTLAAAHLERILSLKPQQGYMLNNLGVALERLGRDAEAHAAFSRAAELSPRYAQAALNRDRLQHGLDDVERTVSADTLVRWRLALAIDDDAPPSTSPPALTPSTMTTPPLSLPADGEE